MPINLQNKILENNQLDQELYNLVNKYFYQEQKRRYHGNLTEDLALFEDKIKSFRYSIIKINLLRFKKIYFRYLIEPKLYGNK